MRKTLLALCALAVLALSARLSAAPLPTPACPTPLAFLGVLPSFTPAAPATPGEASKPLWLVGGNCAYNFQSCLASCDMQDGACTLRCQCDYCVCAKIECLQECYPPEN